MKETNKASLRCKLLVLGLCIVAVLIGAQLLSVALAEAETDFQTTTVDAAASFVAAVSREDPSGAAALFPLALGQAESETYYRYRSSVYLFESSCHVLLCRYAQEAYPAARAAAEARYPLRTKALDTGETRNGEPVTIPPYGKLRGDEFRFILPKDQPEDPSIRYYFYHHSVMLICNDAAHEIGYLVFRDKDLDEVKDLAEFLKKDCGWRLIRPNETHE